MILFALMLIPLVFAMLVVISPAAQAKTIATVGSFVSLAGAIYAAMQFDPASAATFQLAKTVDWIPQLGISLSVGVVKASARLSSEPFCLWRARGYLFEKGGATQCTCLQVGGALGGAR